MLGWSKAIEQAAKDASVYIKLGDGDSVIGGFIGEPSSREFVWTGERGVDPGSEEGKEAIAGGERVKVRFSINLYVFKDEATKVFDMSKTVFNDLVKLKNKYNLEDWSFEIQRTGSGSATKYTILPDDRLSEEQKAKVKAAELIPLDDSEKEPLPF